ncbi:hypothetical protein AB0L97_37660 [Nocardia sp. NPDC051911]|uniref:terpene synthase family protein n=1 Tax=Nocardia sp. NPDC051911 TaxID=3154648 RepID=UPI003436C9A2
MNLPSPSNSETARLVAEDSNFRDALLTVGVDPDCRFAWTPIQRTVQSKSVEFLAGYGFPAKKLGDHLGVGNPVVFHAGVGTQYAFSIYDSDDVDVMYRIATTFAVWNLLDDELPHEPLDVKISDLFSGNGYHPRFTRMLSDTFGNLQEIMEPPAFRALENLSMQGFTCYDITRVLSRNIHTWDIDTYLGYRFHDIFLKPEIPLLDLVYSEDYTASRADPDVHRLMIAIILFIIHANDRISLNKELLAPADGISDDRMNMFLIGTPPSMQEFNTNIAGYAKEIVSVVDELENTPHATYARKLLRFARGVVHFHLISERYVQSRIFR